MTLTDDQIEKAITLCEETLSKAYCIYSKFPVACVLITECGKLITGCNVENASYGIGICAERTAAVKAVSEGYRKFKACFILTNLEKKGSPCGACRQFLAEFGLDLPLYLVARSRKYEKHQLRDLLPHAFVPSDLGF